MKADRLHKFNSLALPKFVKYKNKVKKTFFEYSCVHHEDVKIVLYSIQCHRTLQVAVRCTILSQLLLVGSVYFCSCLVCIVVAVLCVLLQLSCLNFCSSFVCIVVVVLCVLLQLWCVFLQLSCVYCCSCLLCIVVILCLFVVVCVYGCFYFRCRTAGLKSVFGRSCDRPSQHLFFLDSLCL